MLLVRCPGVGLGAIDYLTVKRGEAEHILLNLEAISVHGFGDNPPSFHSYCTHVGTQTTLGRHLLNASHINDLSEGLDLI